MMRRIDQLDWLRGLMALSIMLYHCASYVSIGLTVDSSTVLGKLGIYGVSVFFILSGLSMAYVYHSRLDNIKQVAIFFVRRVFRIWPLLTLVVTVYAAFAWRSGHPYGIGMLVANATGLFGFFAPTAYINAGAWSIGNEMVFYALTPLFIAAYARSQMAGNAAVSATAIIGAVFAFYVLNPGKSLDSQWANYINPFNNLCLFTAGIALFYNANDLDVRGVKKAALFIIPIVLFVGLPSAGDHIAIVTGARRIVLSLAAVGIVLAFYKAMPSIPVFLDRALERLGLISYSVYLIHPLAIGFAIKLLGGKPSAPILFVSIVVVGTVVAAYVIYMLIERPLIQLGKAITSGNRKITEMSSIFTM